MPYPPSFVLYPPSKSPSTTQFSAGPGGGACVTFTSIMNKEKEVLEIESWLDKDGESQTSLSLADDEWKPGRQEYAVMLTLATVSLMVALDATILVPVLPQMALDLNGKTTDAFWAGTSYLLASAVCQPFIAALSDVFGRRNMLLSSILLFTLGTALCAPLAKNFSVLFAGRSMQGMGGGGIITMGQVIFADIVPLRQRPKYFSLVLGAWALGSVLGPLAGGLFVEHLTWRWCFYVNFPFCLFGFIFVPFCVKLKTEKTSLLAKLARVDWLGNLLFMGGMISFLIGLSWAGIQFDWISYQTLVPMAAGIVAVLACIVWERWGASDPFLRPSLFRSPSAIAGYACSFSQGFLLFCALYYVPFYFMAVRFNSPTKAGINIFPVTCLLIPGSILVSILASRLGRFRWAIWSGWAITAAGCALLLLLNETTPVALWAGILSVFGIGNGMILTSINVAIQAISDVPDCGRAAALYAFTRSLGMTIGVAVGGTVFQNVMAAKLSELRLPEEISHEAEGYIRILATLPAQSPERVNVLIAYVQGFHGVFWAMTGIAGFGLLTGLFIKHHSMDKILDSKFTLEGGSGSRARKTLETVERRISRLSRHLSSQFDVAASRVSVRFSINLDGAARRASAMFLSPHAAGVSAAAEAAQIQNHKPSQFVPNSVRSLYRTSPFISSPLRSEFASTKWSSEQAPAVAFYVTPGERRMPVDIPTQMIEEPEESVRPMPRHPRPSYMADPPSSTASVSSSIYSTSSTASAYSSIYLPSGFSRFPAHHGLKSIPYPFSVSRSARSVKINKLAKSRTSFRSARSARSGASAVPRQAPTLLSADSYIGL